jgi:hypothetical protein
MNLQQQMSTLLRGCSEGNGADIAIEILTDASHKRATNYIRLLTRY